MPITIEGGREGSGRTNGEWTDKCNVNKYAHKYVNNAALGTCHLPLGNENNYLLIVASRRTIGLIRGSQDRRRIAGAACN